ncbi:MAG: potassium channel family protein [Microcoleaceae cyanobacterium]
MDLSRLSFFRNNRVEKEPFAVIGLGRFGLAVCATLHNSGHEVLAVDKDEKKVQHTLSSQIASHALQLDSTEAQSLAEAGVYDFNTVIVAVGNYLAESITTTLNLKEGGVKNVVAKASSATHKKILEKVGADLVVFPEREMGTELARRLTRPQLLEEFELDAENSIVEMLVPSEFDGKTISELELRGKYGLTLLAVRDEKEHSEINPLPNKRLKKGMVMVVLGFNRDINHLLVRV